MGLDGPVANDVGVVDGDRGAKVDIRWERADYLLDQAVEAASAGRVQQRAAVLAAAGRAGQVETDVALLELAGWVGDLSHEDRCDTIWQKGCEAHGVLVGKGGVVGDGARCGERSTQKDGLESGRHDDDLVVFLECSS